MRVFLDANILFSAARSDGALRRLIEMLLAARHELVADDFVLTEARRNLERKSGPSAVEALDALVSRIAHVTGGSEGRALAPFVQLHAKDLPVLTAAIRNHCSILVTGDRAHFGQLFGRTIRGVWIGSPRSAAERLFGK